MRGDAKLTVTRNDTAAAIGSGTVDVLATPRLIALCEQACLNSTREHLDPGITTVSMRVQFDHLQPTPVGEPVVAEAVLRKVDGRRLSFEVSASDAGGIVAAGKFVRVVMGTNDLMDKCCGTSGPN